MARNFLIAAFLGSAMLAFTSRAACAQDAPASSNNTGSLKNSGPFIATGPGIDLEALKREADGRAHQWSQLAATLEQRIAGMLPCDEHVATAIDEVSRSSEARLAAAAKYLQARAAELTAHSATLSLFLKQEQTHGADWARDRHDAEQERTSINAHLIALKASAERAPTLAEAEKLLETIAAATAQMSERAGQRETSAAAFIDDLRSILRQMEPMRTANEDELEALQSKEAPAWREYYSARMARARAECSVTNSDAPPQRRNTASAASFSPSKSPVAPKPSEGGN